jgi:hypothetical protein
MPKLYYGAGSAPWMVPGKQARYAYRVDVPSTPNELAQWLNDRGVPCEVIGDGEAVAPAELQIVPDKSVPDGYSFQPSPKRDEQCPRCKFDHASAERTAEVQMRQATVQGRVAWVEQASAYELGELASAIAHRFEQLAKGTSNA